MQYGVYLSGVGECANAALLANLAGEAEASGWDGAFLWDHIAQPHSAVDPWVTLAAIAVKTKRIKLGPIVTPLARRHPWKLARETVTLDHLSQGRLVLGVGLGWGSPEFDTFCEDSHLRTRAEKLDEGLEVLTGLWSGELFNHTGKHYQVKDAQFLPRPLQRPRIPIWVCGAWPDKKAPFRRAARWDGVVAICAENRAILPGEIRAIKAYIARHRTSDAPFDVVAILWSEGVHTPEEQQVVERYSDAGVTWWLEDLSVERFQSIDGIRSRLCKGPPDI